MSTDERPLGHRPDPAAPTHLEVLNRSKRLTAKAVELRNVEALSIELQRMRGAIHECLKRRDLDHAYQYEAAATAAEDGLRLVVGLLAHARTNGFTRVVA